MLRGNPGQRALNDAEPKPPVGDVVRPGFLSEMAVVVWDEVASTVIAMGTLTPADVQSFATYCELEASRRATSQAKSDRELFRVKQEDGGDAVIVVDNILDKEVKLATALRPYYEKFGMEPSGRARLKVAKSDQPANKWAAMGMA